MYLYFVLIRVAWVSAAIYLYFVAVAFCFRYQLQRVILFFLGFMFFIFCILYPRRYCVPATWFRSLACFLWVKNRRFRWNVVSEDEKRGWDKRAEKRRSNREREVLKWFFLGFMFFIFCIRYPRRYCVPATWFCSLACFLWVKNRRLRWNVVSEDEKKGRDKRAGKNREREVLKCCQAVNQGKYHCNSNSGNLLFVFCSIFLYIRTHTKHFTNIF